MKIEKLIVPSGIRYISDWKDYSLTNFDKPHILNKTLTGCGFTEYCIRNPLNVILCSPRRILLENKEDQHKGEVYYVRNEIEKSTDFEKDFSNTTKPAKSDLLNKLGLTVNEDNNKEKILKLKQSIVDYWNSCKEGPFNPAKPCKILVTYDSFRHVKEALGEDIKDFYIVIDEFQSIFTDAKFKSNTELEFTNQLKDLSRVCYVSATPMLTKYLEMLDYFKDLPYFELDWYEEDHNRVIKPQLNVKYCGKKNTIQAEIKKVVDKYRKGIFETYRYKDDNGKFQEIESKEAVIYVNSVVDITKAIKGNNLTIDQCNILVSNTASNEDRIRKAFGGKKRDGISYIGKVPKQGEQHKMFTFCTRTVYLGADFYSTCAKTYIFSNANIDSLSVDVSMDLPQILGRQRLDENPWKNSADLYITLRYEGKKSKEEFKKYIELKLKKTESLLKAYTLLPEEDKSALVENFDIVAKVSNYKTDYVAVNHHSGSIAIPVKNDLMLISELRTFEIQEYDYKDRVSIFNRILNSGNNISENKDKIDYIINNFTYQYTTFVDKMKYLCDQGKILNTQEYLVVLNSVPMEYKNYITTLGIDKIKGWGYKRTELDKAFKKELSSQNPSEELINSIYSEFKIGNKYSKAKIKEKLKFLYDSQNYNKTPKASDLEQWFELKSVLLSENGKRIHGFEIIKKKGD